MMGHRSTSTETANEEKIDEESSSDPLATYSQHPPIFRIGWSFKREK